MTEAEARLVALEFMLGTSMTALQVWEAVLADLGRKPRPRRVSVPAWSEVFDLLVVVLLDIQPLVTAAEGRKLALRAQRAADGPDGTGEVDGTLTGAGLPVLELARWAA
ncbi:hypothetical protein [Skermanella stibiiresistens]|nr:hypothetical protein [Skermanella stibiiresistens]